MAERTVKVRLEANVAGFVGGMRAAQKSASDFSGRLLQSAQRNEQALNTVGTALAVIGGAGVIALGLATKAAVDWETAWAGVNKTVDGTPEQMAALEEEIRELATTLPATHEEIAAVAEAAGQLGVRRQDIAKFTETMIDLGETTNLTADEAATSLARFANIMQTPTARVDRLGSVLVDLGNNAATTESEILELGTRLAAAGQIAGLSESDVLAFASTLTSVGVEAEAGGTALSKTFTKVRDAVIDGGDELETFAQVAGVSVDRFSQKFRKDAAGAIALFVDGLGRMNARGKSTTDVFAALSLTDQRLMRSLLSTASAGDLLTDQLHLSGQAWKENTALSEEANKRYQTTAARLQIARNQVNEFAIDMGQAFLPVVGSAASAVGALADKFAALPDPVKQVLGSVTAVGSGIALLGGAALLAVPKIAEFRAAMNALSFSARKLTLSLGVIGIALTVGAAIFNAWAQSEAEAEQAAEELGNTLDQQTGKITANSREWAFNELRKRGLIDQAEDLGISLSDLTDAMLGNDAALRRVNRQLDAAQVKARETGEASEGLGSGIGKAALTVGQFRQEITKGNDALARARERIEQKKAAGLELSDSEQTLLQATEETTAATGEQEDAATDAAAALEEMDKRAEGLDDALKLLNATLGNVEAESAYEAAIDQAADQLAEYRKQVNKGDAATRGMKHALDLGTEAGRANSEALREIWKRASDYAVQAARVEGGQERANRVLRQARGQLIDVATQFLGSRKKAEEYVSEVLGIPKNVRTHVGQPGMGNARSNARGYKNELDNIPRTIYTTIRQRIHRLSTSDRGPLRGFATGGAVHGPGTGTSDSVPILASAGEYIVRKAAVDRYGTAMLDAINATRYATGGLVGLRRFQTGGHVASAPAVVTPEVRVYIGDRELTDMVRVEISEHDRSTRRRAMSGSSR